MNTQDPAPIDLVALLDEHSPSLLDRTTVAAILAEGVARELPQGAARERARTAVAALHDLTRLERSREMTRVCS